MAVQSSNAAVRMGAPQRETTVRPRRQNEKPHLVPRRHRAKRTRNAAASAIRVTRIALICITAFVMLSLLIYQRAQLAMLDVESVRVQEQLTKSKSETVRLESIFNSKVSVENVEEYAKNKLGMVKRSSYQVRFFLNDNSDQVVLADKAGKP